MTKKNILQAIRYLGTSGDSFLDIENYEKYRFSQTPIHCHHKREITEGKTRQQLIDEGKYYNIPASDLIFLTKSEHTTLHKESENNPWRGKHHSEETLKKMSESKRGKKNNMFGKRPSVETRRKMSESQRARWEKRRMTKE